MSNKTACLCLRCGTCCLTNAFALMSEGDLKRWKYEERDDILSIMENWHPVWMGDHLINSANGRLIHNCPFLIMDAGNFCSCQIYETRPEACREYTPGSSRICPLFSFE